MMAEGADVVDVGGESSRPGAEPVPSRGRAGPGGAGRRGAGPSPAAAERGVRVSVDTVKREVAEAAVAAGASLVNDISASLWDVAAATGAGWVAMHMQGRPRTMQDGPPLRRRGGRGRTPSCWSGPRARSRAGVARGLGRSRDRLRQDAGPQPVAAARTCPSWSRPRPAPGAPGSWSAPAASASSGLLGAGAGAEPAPVADRVEASLATAAAAMVAGAGMVRVHDVAATVQVARLYGPAA